MKKVYMGIFTSVVVSFVPFVVQAASATSNTLPTPRRVVSDEELKPHFGVQVGMASPEGSYRNGLEYGINAGFQPVIPFGLGVELSTSRTDAKNGNEALRRTNLWVNGSYNFGGHADVIRYSYIGVGVGSIFQNDRSDLAIAPLMGFDIPIDRTQKDFASVGAEAKYAFISGGNPDALSVNGVIKYWY